MFGDAKNRGKERNPVTGPLNISPPVIWLERGKQEMERNHFPLERKGIESFPHPRPSENLAKEWGDHLLRGKRNWWERGNRWWERESTGFFSRNATAAKNVSNRSGTCYTMPLLGAFLADAYLGGYWTIASFSLVYFFGMTLLTMSAVVPGLKPSCNDNGVCHPTSHETTIMFIGLYLIALGTGGIKPCVSAFGADEFDDTDEREKKKKASYFNWFYFSINVGALIDSSVLVWIQTNVGWGLGFGIPAIAMGLAVISFFSGSRLYRLQKPGGSPLTGILQVIVASIRNRHAEVPADPSLLHETNEEQIVISGSRKLKHTEGLACLDKAAVDIQHSAT